MMKYLRSKELVEVTVVITTLECQVYLTVFKDKLEAQVQEPLHPSYIPKTGWVKERDKAIMVYQ
jgi:hypothetical protein